MNTAVQSKQKLPSFLSLILVAILGITLAKLMWIIITPKNQVITQTQTNGVISSKPKAKINYGKLIANHHLFGKVKIKKAPIIKETPKVTIAKAQPTKLKLKLHGIVAYKGTKRGFALISSANSKQKVYGKGDTIQKGVIVSEIFSNKVVLDNNGKVEELTLPVKKAKKPSIRTPGTSFELGGNSNRRPPKRTNHLPSTAKKATTDFNLGAFRQEVMNSSPRKLLEIATPSPAKRNGKFIGFRIQPGRQRKVFRQLGFRPNDIVTEVNGIILDDASKAAMVLGELSQASDLNVKVLRGRQEVFIQHSF